MSRLQKFPHGIFFLLISLLCLSLGGVLAFAPPTQAHRAADKQRITKSKPTARHRARVSKTRKLAQIPAPRIEEDAAERSEFEDVEGRQQWFSFERSYPFAEMPANGRREAWESIAANNLAATSEAVISRWNHLGPMPTRSNLYANWGDTSGRINAIAISPADPRIVLVGASTGGVWRSEDSGETFKPVSDDQIDLAVGYLAFAPSNPNVVYAGMGDAHGSYNGSGVLRSTDAGKTWTRVNNNSLPTPGRIIRLEVDPSDAKRVYVAQYTFLSGNSSIASGFYYSTDGGVNWKPTLFGLPRDLVINPANPKTIYVGMARVDQPGNLPAGLYRSTDSGETWSLVYTSPYSTTGDIRVAISAANANRIYVFLGEPRNSASSQEIRLAISQDGGQTWESSRLNNRVDNGQFGYNTYFYADPVQADTLYIGTRDVYKSTNGGVTWANLNNNFNLRNQYDPYRSNVHPDQHSLAFLPGNSNVIFIGNDGGLYKSTDAGKTFQAKNQTLSLSQFVGIAINPNDARLTLVGAQDNGTQMRMATGRWEEIISGDGGQCIFSPTDPSLLFTTYVRGDIYRFRQVAFNSQVGSQPIFGEFNTARIQFYPPLTGTRDGRLYFGSWRLFISRNQGTSWPQLPARPKTRLSLWKEATRKLSGLICAMSCSMSRNSFL